MIKVCDAHDAPISSTRERCTHNKLVQPLLSKVVVSFDILSVDFKIVWAELWPFVIAKVFFICDVAVLDVRSLWRLHLA